MESLLGRVEHWERAFAQQSASVETMRNRAAETDAGIQRLAARIDRLSDRTPIPVALPFEMQMSEAVERQATEEPRVRVIKEGPARIFT